MRLAMFQMKNSGSIKENLEKSLQAARQASENGADLILFPEVQLTEFFPQYPGQDVSKYGIDIHSDIVDRMREACRRNHIIGVPNVYLKENSRFYDASILIGNNGDIIGVQKMVHIAQAENFYEQDYYAASDTGFQVFETEFGKIGIVVCFDRHYPESIRTEVLKGADLILIPTVNTKQEPMKMFEWEIRVQAFQNSVAVAMCNRAGKEGAMEFAGESLAVDADGGLLIKADDSEKIVYADLNLIKSREIRSQKPYVSLRRKEYYE